MSQIGLIPFYRAVDEEGNPFPNARLYTFVTGTLTPQATYTTSALSVSHGSYVQADANGLFPAFYPDPDLSYRYQLRISPYTAAVAGYDFDPVDGASASTLSFLQAGTGAESRTIQAKLREIEVSVFDFLTAAEIAAVQAYTFVTDVTSGINAAVDHAYRNSLSLKFPPGGYLVTQIVLPDDPAIDPRGYGFEMVGAGRGEAFVINNPRGTVIRGNDATLATLKFQQTAPNYGSGVLLVHDIRFEGTQNSGVPVADFEALYGTSRLYNCDFYQKGAGDGVHIGFMATGSMDHCYIVNGALIGGDPSWNVDGVQTRTGIGLKLTGDINCGLATFQKITSRGWNWGYDMGDPADTVVLFATRMESCEVSVCTNGLLIREKQRDMVVESCYFEGVSGGTVILNEGDYTRIINNHIGAPVAADTWLVGIDDSSTTNFGTLIDGNDIQCAAQSACVMMKVASTGAYGGAGKVVKGNTFSWSQSGAAYAGVVGFQISGIDPRIEYSGNAFSPRGPWVGGAGTTKLSDLSTSTGGGALSRGLYGMATVANADQEFPLLAQGMISLGRPQTALGDAALATGVLTTGDSSFCELTLTGAANVTSFAPGGVEGRVVYLRVTNANPTFVHSANLLLDGSVNYTPGANGCMICFFVSQATGGIPIAYEMSRVAY